jgi:hypothetical protein
MIEYKYNKQMMNENESSITNVASHDQSGMSNTSQSSVKESIFESEGILAINHHLDLLSNDMSNRNLEDQ